jgi:hypothetical protein
MLMPKLYLAILSLVLMSACYTVRGRDHNDVFRTDNYVAWCIVPYDKAERSSQERAQMLRRIGITKLAYDWRVRHVPEFEDEILACQEYGIEFFAFWDEHPVAFALFEKYDLHPQIWKTVPSPEAATQEERVRLAGTVLLPLVEKTREMGSKLGLYNHGGWGGEATNMIAVMEWLRSHTEAGHVGIVYNFHHGHDRIGDFAQQLELVLPYLLCLNLNGMNAEAQPKILPVGQGTHEATMIRIIADSTYAGPIGILDHLPEVDSEIALKDNLDGLNSILAAFE